MELYSMTLVDLTVHGNGVKEALLHALERDGLLKEGAEAISKKYVVLIHKPSWFGRAIASLIGMDKKDQLTITVAKIV